ncbi:MAG: fatty acid desaturase family protein [Myxococcota bacterium]
MSAIPLATESADPHPHDLRAPVPDRLPGAVVRELSAIDPARALGAVAVEWAGIVAAILLAELARAYVPAAVWLYPLVVVWIGARQHALTVIGHDAVHHRFLPDRRWNDWVADLFVLWPVFVTVEGFRKFHGEHHQHLGVEGDGNRFLWRTHHPDGTLRPEWIYPKTPLGFAAKVLRRAAFFTGVFWMLRGVVGSLLFARSAAARLARLAWWGAVITTFTLTDTWGALLVYWIVPYCTWHLAIQYIRLACEHSAVPSAHPAYGQTRTTIPHVWERWLILPRNIGYHLEHHWYPAVPCYRLPDLHAALMAKPGFRDRAVVTHSVAASVAQMVGR